MVLSLGLVYIEERNDLTVSVGKKNKDYRLLLKIGQTWLQSKSLFKTQVQKLKNCVFL